MNSLKTHHRERPAISRVRALFGIDSRSLAVFRMAVGTLLLIDLSIRSGDLTTMYSDQGVMPIAAVRQQLAGTWYWSLHFFHGSPFFQATLFIVAALLAIALLFGLYTRIATIGSWIMLASIYTRAPYAVNGGDTLLVILLFWSMFLPLGKTWSLDARREHARSNPHYSTSVVLSMGTCAILIQVFLVFFCTIIFKLIYHEDLTNLLQDMLIWGDYNKPLGKWLLGHPTLTWLLSLMTMGLQLVGPWLLFVPWRTATFRLFTIAGFVLFHIGTEMTVTVGLFSYIALAAWTLLLPTEFWVASCWNPIRRLFSQFTSSNQLRHDSEQTKSGDVHHRRPPFVVTCIVTVCLLFVILYNVLGLIERKRGSLTPTAMKRVAEALVLRQKWAMFSKEQPTNIWYVAQARLVNGKQVDLLRGGRPVEHPTRSSRQPNHRWVKYLQGINKPSTPEIFRMIYAQHLFDTWNATHNEAEQIQLLELLRFRQVIVPESEGAHFATDIFGTVRAKNTRVEDTIEWDVPWKGP